MNLSEMQDLRPVARSVSRDDFHRLVTKIQDGDASAVDELTRLLDPGIRFFLSRSLHSSAVEQAVREVTLRVIKAIQNKELEDADRLLGYVRGVLQLRICGAALELRKPPRRDSAGARTADALRRLSDREREVLRRFYVLGQEESQILAEMNLTAFQFRSLKSAVREQIERERESTCRK